MTPNLASRFLKSIFTGEDGNSYMLANMVAVATAVVLLMQFVRTDSDDFLGLGQSMSWIIGAIALHNFVDGRNVAQTAVKPDKE